MISLVVKITGKTNTAYSGQYGLVIPLTLEKNVKAELRFDVKTTESKFGRKFGIEVGGQYSWDLILSGLKNKIVEIIIE